MFKSPFQSLPVPKLERQYITVLQGCERLKALYAVGRWPRDGVEPDVPSAGDERSCPFRAPQPVPGTLHRHHDLAATLSPARVARQVVCAEPGHLCWGRLFERIRAPEGRNLTAQGNALGNPPQRTTP